MENKIQLGDNMQIKEIENILRKNPNFDLIWIPSSEKNHQILLNRLNKQTKNLIDGNKEKYNHYKQTTKNVRGVMMVGKANNRLSNAEQRKSAIMIEKNISANRFDKICEDLPIDLWSRIFC
jgi:hypothetical protein